MEVCLGEPDPVCKAISIFLSAHAMEGAASCSVLATHSLGELDGLHRLPGHLKGIFLLASVLLSYCLIGWGRICSFQPVNKCGLLGLFVVGWDRSHHPLA